MVDASVLVLDGDTRTALAVTRSLGNREVQVTVASATRSCLAGSSRYCKYTLIYPNPSTEPEAFESWLLDILHSHRFGVLMPLTDITTAMVSAIRSRIPEHVKAALPSPESLDAVLDKGSLVKLASDVGIPVPKTWEPVNDNTVPLIMLDEYPVVVRSRRSFYRAETCWVDGELQVARNCGEMTDSMAAIHSRIPDPLVQEYIPGWGEGLFVLCNHGELRATFAHRRIRETPPSGGVSTVRESVAVKKELLSSVETLLKKLEWHGPAMFEFRVDGRTQIPKLLEVNPRFWGSLHLAIVSGMDFPWLLYRMLLNGDVDSQFNYKTGEKSRWFLGDFNRLLLAAGARKKGAGSRTSELFEFIRPGRHTHREIESLRDPGPAIYEYKKYAVETLSTIGGKLRSGMVK